MTSFDAVVAELQGDRRFRRHVRCIQKRRRIQAALLAGLCGIAAMGPGYGIYVHACDQLRHLPGRHPLPPVTAATGRRARRR